MYLKKRQIKIKRIESANWKWERERGWVGENWNKLIQWKRKREGKKKTHTKLFWMEKSEKSEWIRMENAKRKHMKKRDQISNYWLLVYTSKEKPNSNKLHSFNSSVFFSPIHLRMFDFTFLFQNVPFENDEKEIWKGVFLKCEKKESLELNFNLFCMRKNEKTQKKRGKKRENCIFVFLSNRKCGGFSCQIQNRSNFFHFLAGECNSVGRCFYLNCSLDCKIWFLFASEWSVVKKWRVEEKERVNDVLRKGELFACYSVFGCITVTILLIFCVNLCVYFVSLIKLQCSHVYWYLWFLFSVSWIVLNRFLSFFGWWMEDVLFFVQLSICGLCTFSFLVYMFLKQITDTFSLKRPAISYIESVYTYHGNIINFRYTSHIYVDTNHRWSI